MKISTDNGTIRNALGDLEALRLIHEAGFDGVDFTFYDMVPERDILALPREERYRLAMELREYAEANGMAFPQSHAPYNYHFGDSTADKSYQDVLKSLEFSGWIGCPQEVIHTLKFPIGTDEAYCNEINRLFLRGFLPYAEEYNVDIGVENLFVYDSKRRCFAGQHGTPEKMNAFVDSLGDPRFKVCCDTGHAAITGTEPEAFVAGMTPDRMTMLHVHDTDYLNDSHTIPHLGKHNWDAFADALAKIGYSGYLNLEVLFFYDKFPPKLYPAALRLAAEAAREVADLVESRLR